MADYSLATRKFKWSLYLEEKSSWVNRAFFLPLRNIHISSDECPCHHILAEWGHIDARRVFSWPPGFSSTYWHLASAGTYTHYSGLKFTPVCMKIQVFHTPAMAWHILTSAASSMHVLRDNSRITCHFRSCLVLCDPSCESEFNSAAHRWDSG